MTEFQQKMGPPDPEQPQPPEQRVRKRRRRTMACTQCRSRKLRCDREYPTCGRCLKSKTPTKCTYEDGFLWQQPNTVASPVFSDRGSTVTGSDAPSRSGARTHYPGLGDKQSAASVTTTTIALYTAVPSWRRETKLSRDCSRSPQGGCQPGTVCEHRSAAAAPASS